MRRAIAVVAGGLLLAGCESTQSKSARLERAAKEGVNKETGLSVTRESSDVRVVTRTVLQDANGTAVVLELRNRSRRALAAVPVALTVRGAGGQELWANDAPGLDPALVQAPLVPARGTVMWVNDQVPVKEPARDVATKVGADARPAPSPLPRIVVRDVRLERDPSSGIAVTGKVVNRSKIEQQRLTLFVVARRGKRPVAAGRAVIPRLRAGGTSRFTAFLIGDPRGARVEVSAPPSVLNAR